MFRRALPIGAARSCLDRLSSRLTKIAAETRKLDTPSEWAEIGRLCRQAVEVTVGVTEPIMLPFWTHNLAAYVVVTYWFHSTAFPTFDSLLDP
jgi:hypothetical protein